MNPAKSRPPQTYAAWMLAVLLSMALVPDLEAAAIREEVFAIVPGWNLIHIDGEPLVKDLSQALVGVDWGSLWTWVPPGAGESGGRWVVQHRDAPAFLDTLVGLVGSTSYLLFARSAGSLKVKAYVRPRRAALRGGAFQLFSPAVSASSPPTLAGYFSRPGVKEHLMDVYELAGGAYRRVGAGDALRAGAAYWVLVNQDLPAPDPVRVQFGLGGLRFDSQVTVAEIEIDVVASSVTRQMNLRAVPSADGRSTADWLVIQAAGGSLQGAGGGGTVSIDVPPDQTRVRVAVRAERTGVVSAGTLGQGAVIDAVLPDGRVTVSAELTSPLRQGIWIGEAVLAEVERPSFHGGGLAPASRLPVSLIFEIPIAGSPRLLPCLQVEAQRDGRKRAYRMEEALFQAPVELQGTLAADGTSGVLTGSVRLAPADPSNPYRHRYHPEHGLGYDLTRSFKLDFGAQGPAEEGPENPLATVGVLGGVYEEELRGLAQEPIRVRGAFRLRHLAEGTAVPCAAQ